MKLIEYRLNGRKASLETARLYRHVESGCLRILQSNGRLRNASPDEVAAYNAATAPEPEPRPDFQAMSKKELETYALGHFGVDLDRRKSTASLIAEIEAIAAG